MLKNLPMIATQFVIKKQLKDLSFNSYALSLNPV